MNGIKHHSLCCRWDSDVRRVMWKWRCRQSSSLDMVFFLSSCTYWCLVKWFWSHHHIHMFISSHSLPLGRALLRCITWLVNLLACTSCEMMSFGAWLFWYETFRSNVVTPTAVSPGDAEKTAMKSLSPDGGGEFFFFTVVAIGVWNSVTKPISIYC